MAMMQLIFRALLLISLGGTWLAPCHAGEDQRIGILTNLPGATAAENVTAAGLVDYLEMLNLRDGGISGVRLSWAACDDPTGDRRTLGCFDRLALAGAAVVAAVSSSASEQLLETSRSRRIPVLIPGSGHAEAIDGRSSPYVFALGASLRSQAATQIRFIGIGEGGMDRLRGKRIGYLYSAMENNSKVVEVLESLAARWEFELIKLVLPAEGASDTATWQQVGARPADWLLLWAPGSMTAGVLKAAAEIGFPARRIIGSGSSAAAGTLVAAGPAAAGFVAVALEPDGVKLAVLRDIFKHRIPARSRAALQTGEFGSARYNRGVMLGVLIGEAIRVGQKRHGNKPLNGQQLQGGLERLVLDEAALARLGALELLPTLQLSCNNHQGGQAVKMQQWLGSRWTVVSDWISANDAFEPRRVEPVAAPEIGAGPRAPGRECTAD